MKKIAFISVLAICIVFLVSCNEAETPQSPDTIDGFWTSIAPISNDGDMLFEAIEFNGSAARVATMKLGKTSLVVAGTPQTAEYSFDKQSGTGTMTMGGGAELSAILSDGFGRIRCYYQQTMDLVSSEVKTTT